ncbi:cation channel sperm-associated auxiliary subunit beta-like isoform X1 [Dipodomys merriami]|uniref:cation channel sperm-associated auxiliary subunit beta-like isoform X1 n=1 Tax=Dipodomys merriami TaxID=94247 RepID=UPI003855B27F
MDSQFTYVLILLLNLFEYSSGIIYNKGDMKRSFACSSEGFPKDSEIIKLFLSLNNLEIHCFFQTEDELTSKGLLSVFTSGGLAPSLEILNSTYHGIFHFNLTLFSDRVFWLIDIPRENITRNTDIAATEQWLVRISLHQGLNIYTTEGTLLDSIREPILQWNLGNVMTPDQLSLLYPHVLDLKVAKCPCANDVALLGFVMNFTYSGVFIGITFSGFWNYNDTIWYDLTSIMYSQLQEEHAELTLIDMVLANHYLIMLTSLGLYVSEDLLHPTNQIIKLFRADFCGFERVDYVKGKLWYNERCFANREHFEVDYVTVTFDRNRTLSESSSCFYSQEPFLNWMPCIPYNSKSVKSLPKVITFLVDPEQNTGIYLFSDTATKRTMVTVNVLQDSQPSLQTKFPPFHFPASFSNPLGMVFHPRSHFLYVYGNQVWISMDGGNTFELICAFYRSVIKNTYHSFYTSDIVLVSINRRIYLTKAGLQVFTRIGIIDDPIFTLYYDHLGFIHKLTPDHFDAGAEVGALGSSTSIFGEAPDLGFETALAPQYISLNEMAFFAYVPLNEPVSTVRSRIFRNFHFGKLIHSGKSGVAAIKKVLRHKKPVGFLTSVLTELIEPFAVEEANESSCLSSSLSIEETRTASYKLVLDPQVTDASFEATDIEKTVILPGFSSFLITEIIDTKNALAFATMPRSVPKNTTFSKGHWYLHNFGQRNGRTWKIFLKPCNYLLQQLGEDQSINSVKYIDVGNTQKFAVKVIPNTKGIRTLDMPLIKVLVGNPNLLDVSVNGSFDNTDSYSIDISVTSRSVYQGSTSLALVMWEASSECFVTTLVPTLKSSCSYLRAMRHIPSMVIPPEDWLSGEHQDSQGFNRIKTLPVNYRPPSNMGIAIPLTDNFYHADPSKPIPRNLFHKSQETGKYKQCAGASNREECNCTNDQKLSDSVAFSDCKEKVPRFKFPVTQYPVSLEIYSEDGLIPVKPTYLVTVTEVNTRKNWELRHTIPENIKKMKRYLEPVLGASVYNPLGLNLSIKGSELFHFRVSVVPGVTFCNLVEEFQIYVDDVPLPFPGHTLIAVATAVVMGALIFTVFMFQLRNIHPGAAIRKWIQGNKVNISNSSVS